MKQTCLAERDQISKRHQYSLRLDPFRQCTDVPLTALQRLVFLSIWHLQLYLCTFTKYITVSA